MAGDRFNSDEETILNDSHGLHEAETASIGDDLVFLARLRGVSVTCVIPTTEENQPCVAAVRVEVTATDVARGLAAVSKFAGYCPRTLVLTDPSGDDAAWASVLASYFRFGLAVVVNGSRQDVMPPARLDESSGASVRERFRGSVRQYVDHL